LALLNLAVSVCQRSLSVCLSDRRRGYVDDDDAVTRNEPNPCTGTPTFRRPSNELSADRRLQGRIYGGFTPAPFSKVKDLI